MSLNYQIYNNYYYCINQFNKNLICELKTKRDCVGIYERTGIYSIVKPFLKHKNNIKNQFTVLMVKNIQIIFSFFQLLQPFQFYNFSSELTYNMRI